MRLAILAITLTACSHPVPMDIACGGSGPTVLLVGDSQVRFSLAEPFRAELSARGFAACTTGKGGRSAAAFLKEPGVFEQIHDLRPVAVVYEFGSNDAGVPSDWPTLETYPELIRRTNAANIRRVYLVGPPAITEPYHLPKVATVEAMEKGAFGENFCGAAQTPVGSDGVHVTRRDGELWGRSVTDWMMHRLLLPERPENM